MYTINIALIAETIDIYIYKLTCLCNLSGWGNTSLCILHTVGTNTITLVHVSWIEIPSNIGVSTNRYLNAFPANVMSKLCSIISRISCIIRLKEDTANTATIFTHLQMKDVSVMFFDSNSA